MLMWKTLSHYGKVLENCIVALKIPADTQCPAYSTNRALLADGAGQRLENFFWRIWGSQDILNTVTGTQVAVLFNAISIEGPLRTTPTQSPRTSRQIGSYMRTPPLSHSPVGGESRLKQASKRGEPPSVISESEESILDSRPTTIPEPTVQAQALPYQGSSGDLSRSPEASSYKIITEDDGDDSTPTGTPPSNAQKFAPLSEPSSAVGASNVLSKPRALLVDSETLRPEDAEISSTVQSASSEDTVRETPKRTGRKRTAFHVNTPANRRRPVAMRRQSSQSSSVAPNVMSARPSALVIDMVENNGPVDRSRTSLSRSSDTYPAVVSEGISNPHNALQDPPNVSTGDPSPTYSTSSRRQQESSLVEPDFRSRFVAKTRSAQSSFVSLPSLLRTPSATTAASASYQASGTMDTGRHLQSGGRGKARVTFSEDTAPPHITNPVGSNSEPDRGAQGLPRTKSQLTLLLEKDRRRGNGNGRGGKH